MNKIFSIFIRRGRGGNPSAFSLIEMMITVALLAFMIVGLVGMFVQTQRAFRSGMAQTDVLEAGRATTDLLTRQLEEMSPANVGNTTNFYSLVWPGATQSLTPSASGPVRVNELDELFFLQRENLNWTGMGYLVAPLNNGVGTLYSFQWPASGTNNPAGLANIFRTVAQNVALAGTATNYTTYLHRVADGIVHLRVQAYGADGNLIDVSTNGISVFTYSSGGIDYTFTNNAVPAYVELELGVLEHETLEKFKALPSSAQAAYLSRSQTAGRVHIFRRHIAVRNVDPTAYQ